MDHAEKHAGRSGAARPTGMGIAPWAAFACCVTALLSLWFYQVRADRTQRLLDTALAAEQARQRLDACLGQREDALAHTASRWSERFMDIPTAMRSRVHEIMAWFPGVLEVAILDHTGAVAYTVLPPGETDAHFAPGSRHPLAVFEGPLAAHAPTVARLAGPPRGAPDAHETLVIPAKWRGGQPDGWLCAILDLQAIVDTCVRDRKLGGDYRLVLRDSRGRPRAVLGADFPPDTVAGEHETLQRMLDAHWSWSVAASTALSGRSQPGNLLLPIAAVLVSLAIALATRAMPRQAAALQRSEQRMRRLIDLLPHMVYAVGADGRLLLANQACADAFARPVESLPGRTLAQLGMDPAEARAAAAEDARVLAEHSATHTPAQPFTDRRGQRRLLEVARVPVPGRGGEEEAVLVIATDITERTRAERELERYRTQLEALVGERTAALESAQRDLLRSEKMATLGQLMATVSHELRNPLGTIAAALYTIARAVREGDAPASGPAVERAERNIRRCEAIIEELLDFARVHPPRLSPQDFDTWLREVIDEYVLPEGYALEVALGAGASPAFDQERVRRAVVNLLDNARLAIAEARATNPGHPARIVVRSGRDGDELWCAVEDSGPGISPEALERIFEPLFSTRSFGLGLGLPIVRQVIEQHHGQVSIAANPAGGCTARFTLPLGDAQQAA